MTSQQATVIKTSRRQQRPDALKAVMNTLLEEHHREVCDSMVSQSGCSYFDLGFGLRFHHLEEESLSAMKRAHEEQPWNFNVNFQIAVQALRCEQVDDAEQHALAAWHQVRTAMTRNPGNSYFNIRQGDVARILGDIHTRRGDDQLGVEWYRKVVGTAADKGIAAIDVSRRLTGAGNHDAACEVLSDQAKLNPSDRVIREIEALVSAPPPRASSNREDPAGDPRSAGSNDPHDADVRNPQGCRGNQPPPRRIAILVDVSNIEGVRRGGPAAGSELYGDIKDRLSSGAEIVALDAFVPDLPGVTDQLTVSLGELGYAVRSIRARWRGGAWKADADAAIAARAMLYLATTSVDEVWIVSSDEDFVEVVPVMHEFRPNVRICFAGIDQSGHTELAVRGDGWLALDLEPGKAGVLAAA
jgi:uncharacterized LabA/DUF88 family protein